MKLEEFVKLFAEQFDDTDISVFLPSTEYKTLEEWGSLTALSILSMIDDECDVQITGADLRKATTIEELFNYIQTKL